MWTRVRKCRSPPKTLLLKQLSTVLDRVDPTDIALYLTEAILAHFLDLAWRGVVSNGVRDLERVTREWMTTLPQTSIWPSIQTELVISETLF
jgi:hypothetical protein